jgi:predicted nucleic acid-binding protein
LARIAVDTNVFIALFAGDEEAALWAQHALEEAATGAVLAVAPVVYAELVAGRRPPEMVETFFSEKGIEVDWEIGKEVWRAAGLRYGSYARDRRRQGGDPGPRRILADFLVGAHALQFGERTLLTTDRRIFADYFSELRIIAPEKT